LSANSPAGFCLAGGNYHLLRQRPVQLISLFEALEEIIDRCPLSFTGILGDGSSAETIVEMKFQHSFVVYMRTPL